MSTLLSLKVPTPELMVMVSDSEGFAVRGLTPMSVVGLYRRHATLLEPLFQKVMAGVQADGTARVEDLQAVMLGALAETPLLIAELIALGSGGDTSQPDFELAVAIAGALSFPVQTDALAKIGDLTFTSEMPAGKFFALVAMMASKVTRAVLNLPTSGSGYGASAAP